jgi:hypothetical protein
LLLVAVAVVKVVTVQEMSQEAVVAVLVGLEAEQ